ncbi:MAG: UDP-N-acetylglucosamine 2-epimerase, partial [Acidobacteria bacterium]|nr:UDP-N-acetylglucosamine 2-epimerase [Acidobacteriota bacterium]
ETIECGSNILSGADPRAIIDAVTLALESPPWRAPDEYLAEHVSYTVAKIVLGYAP